MAALYVFRNYRKFLDSGLISEGLKALYTAKILRKGGLHGGFYSARGSGRIQEQAWPPPRQSLIH